MEHRPEHDERTLLELRDVTLELGGETIIDQVSLELWSGYIHAIVGPNGAGKSSLANTIMGLSGYRDHQGEILLEGEPISTLSVDERARRGLTMAWQEPARFEGLTVPAFISAGATDPSPNRQRWALELVGLDPDQYLRRAVDRTLSGGERKRIELASILLMKPKLVLLDEPDSGIDVDALNRIFESIGHLRDRGTTVLLITHSQAVLSQADHAFLMCCGRIMEKGRTRTIEEYFGERCMPCDHKNQPTPEELDGTS